MRKFLILYTLLSFIIISLFSQKDSISYNLQTNFLISTSDTPPYWLVSNQRGKYSVEKYQFITSGEINKKLNQSKEFDYGFGLELVNRFDTKNKFWLQQGYGEVKYKFLKLTTGSKNEVFGIHDSLLSSGSFIWSKNARPIPKITLSTPGFIEIPFTNSLFEFSALFSHGWFEKDRYVENPLLHHKNIYLLFGKRLPIEIIAGFDHFAMWGGKSSDPDIGEIPSDWDAFKKVIVAKSYTSVHSNERNAFGNHLGAYHLGIKYKLRGNSFFVYKQHPYEDKSGLRLRNWEDGLWGISVRLNNSILKGLIYEFINTKDQGIEGNYTGEYEADNYFNNSIYQNGWTVYKWVIGSPFIQSQNFSNTLRINNNRTQSHFLGLLTSFNKFIILSQFSYSMNFGNFYNISPPPKYQTYLNLNIRYPILPKLLFDLTTSFEYGELYGNKIGILFKIIYTSTKSF